MSFSRLIWPSACPPLPGSVWAALTAATSPSNPEAKVAIAGAPQTFAVVIQASNFAAALRPEVAVLPTPDAHTSAVKWRARSATALAVASCSTRATTAAAMASRAEVGWTSSHASCRALGSDGSAAGVSGTGMVSPRALRPDGVGFVRRSATKRCTCRLVPG